MVVHAHPIERGGSDFRIKIKKCIEALLKLGLDFFP